MENTLIYINGLHMYSRCSINGNFDYNYQNSKRTKTASSITLTQSNQLKALRFLDIISRHVVWGVTHAHLHYAFPHHCLCHKWNGCCFAFIRPDVDFETSAGTDKLRLTNVLHSGGFKCNHDNEFLQSW